VPTLYPKVPAVMSYILKKKASISDIVSCVRENGVAKIDSFYDDYLVEEIKKEATLALKEDNLGSRGYNFGMSTRIGSFEQQRENRPAIYTVFGSSWMHQAAGIYLEGQPSFNELFITHEFKNNSGLARNGYLHFDRIHTFKYMLYLTDCDEDSGPFSCIPETHKIARKLREETWNRENSYDNLKNRIFVDYPELGVKEADLVPITGPAGTLIIFDTDMFHLGGRVRPGKERLLIRLHVRT